MGKIDAVSDSEQKYIHFYNTDYDSEITLVQCGHHYTIPGYGYGPMIRDHYLIHFVIQGKGRFYLHNNVYNLTAGNCFLIYPHQIAYYESDVNEPWEYCWIGIAGYMVEKILRMIGFSYSKPVTHFNSKTLVGKILQMNETAASCCGNVLVKPLLIDGILREVLYDIVKDSKGRGSISQASTECDTSQIFGRGKYNNEYVNMVLNIIQTSFQENIQVEKIAERVSLNRSYLSALFKKETGKSIKEFLIYYRVEQSLPLLKEKNKSIKEIAQIVGFRDSLYFSRVFKRLKSCSPLEYRESLWQQPLYVDDGN